MEISNMQQIKAIIKPKAVVVFFLMNIMVPREDWCMVGSKTPRAISRKMTLSRISPNFFSLKRSAMAGANSRIITQQYVVTHRATSSMAE